MRADGAFFDHDILEVIEKRRAFYVIVARLTRPLQNRLGGLRYRRISRGVRGAEFQYCPQGWKRARRFVVIRRLIPEEPSAQLHLFQMGRYTYQVFVTNLALKPLNVWRFYNRRATAELIIRELKDAYALGKIPTKDFAANEAFLQIVLLAYNLLNWFKRLCVPPRWQRATLQRMRQRLLVRSGAVGASGWSADAPDRTGLCVWRGLPEHPQAHQERPSSGEHGSGRSIFQVKQQTCETKLNRKTTIFTQDSG